MGDGTALPPFILQAIEQAGGRINFDQYMALALYTPGLGYYSSPRTTFGRLPSSGSDFVTAPELSPLFGKAMARQLGQALEVTGTHELWEFGAGTGALAFQLLSALAHAPALREPVDTPVHRYHIVELSADLQERQRQLLAPWGDRVVWHTHLPASLCGVVIGNEVLDAMPVKLAARLNGLWHERGVTVHEGQLCFADVPAPHLSDAMSVDVGGTHDYLTEVPTHALAFIATLAERLVQGAAFFIDYGFPAHEYYHPERHMGTLVCHYRHLVDTNPLLAPGEKDITSHVDFTALAMAWQNAGDALVPPRELGTLGYCNQGRFLLNCGFGNLLESADPRHRNAALKLVHEHEMGELFKVLGLYVGKPWQALGFAMGDKSHTL
jgi:SAM-dependent MidA family methyltransferase